MILVCSHYVHTMLKSKNFYSLKNINKASCIFLLSGSVMPNSLPPHGLYPWTTACQDPLCTGFSWQELLEPVAISYSRGSSQSRDATCVSCTGRQVLGSPRIVTQALKRLRSDTIDISGKQYKVTLFIAVILSQ